MLLFIYCADSLWVGAECSETEQGWYGLSQTYSSKRASQVALVVKNPPANAGDIRDAGSIPGLGRFPGRGPCNPLQCSCLENPMDRGAWRAAVQRVLKSQTRMKQPSTHTHIPLKVRIVIIQTIFVEYVMPAPSRSFTNIYSVLLQPCGLSDITSLTEHT